MLAANQAFYDAFEASDLDAMSEVWEHSDRVLCTHPGWPTLRGWARVSASFYAMFDAGGTTQFILTAETAEVDGDTAWVALDENLLSFEGGGTVAALNLFTRTPEGWRMVAHHGSPVAADVEVEAG